MTPDEAIEAHIAAFNLADDVVAQLHVPLEPEEELDVRAALEAWYAREAQRPPHPEDCSCGACWCDRMWEGRFLESHQLRQGRSWQGPIEDGW